MGGTNYTVRSGTGLPIQILHYGTLLIPWEKTEVPPAATAIPQWSRLTVHGHPEGDTKTHTKEETPPCLDLARDLEPHQCKDNDTPGSGAGSAPHSHARSGKSCRPIAVTKRPERGLRRNNSSNLTRPLSKRSGY